jgi:hypothetical protein
LNNRNYDTTWNNSSSSFQNIAQGYNSYVKWWDSVNNIEIVNVETISINNNNALVKTQLVYYLNNGKKMTDKKNNIYLVWDDVYIQWLIDQKY